MYKYACPRLCIVMLLIIAKDWNKSKTSVTQNWFFEKDCICTCNRIPYSFQKKKTKLIYVQWSETASNKLFDDKSGYRRKDNMHLFVWEKIRNCILPLYIYTYICINREREYLYMYRIWPEGYIKKKKKSWMAQRKRSGRLGSKNMREIFIPCPIFS